MPFITWKKIINYWYISLIVIGFLVGIIFKLLSLLSSFSFKPSLSYIGDLLILSISAGTVAGLILKRKDDEILREVLGISKDTSLLDAIVGFNPKLDYVVEKRDIDWRFFKNKNEQNYSIYTTDKAQIITFVENCTFNFRRGLADFDLKKITIRQLPNGKLKELDFDEHLLKQKHGVNTCYTMTNLNLEENQKYEILIETHFINCMLIDKDYLSVDIIDPIKSLKVKIDFPFNLDNYKINIKRRSLKKLVEYVKEKRKKNSILIKYNKPLDIGDSMVIYYKKKKK